MVLDSSISKGLVVFYLVENVLPCYGRMCVSEIPVFCLF